MNTIRGFLNKYGSLLAEGFPILVVVIVCVLLARSCDRGDRTKLEAAVRQHQLDSLNMIALRDSTARILTDERAKTATYQRLAVQQTIRGDSLDKKLKQTSKALLAANVHIAALDTVYRGAPATVDAGDTLRAETQVYQRPFHVTAAFIAPPADSVRWKLGVTVDPIRLNLRLACAVGPRGVHQARAQITAPDFATVELSDVQQDAGICTDPPKPPKPKIHAACFAGGAGTAASIVAKQPLVAAGVGLFSVLFLC